MHRDNLKSFQDALGRRRARHRDRASLPSGSNLGVHRQTRKGNRETNMENDTERERMTKRERMAEKERERMAERERKNDRNRKEKQAELKPRTK